MKKFDTMTPCLESPCRDILQAREASSALETLGQLREALERVTLSEGQEGGESFIRMTVTDLLTAIEEAQPNGRAAAAISDLRLLPDGSLSSRRKTPESEELLHEIEELEDLDSYLACRRTLINKVVESSDEFLTEALRVKVTGLLLDAMTPAFSLPGNPAHQIFRDLRLSPPELWNLCLYFLDFDVFSNRFRLVFPHLLTDDDSAEDIENVASTVARLGPELTYAALEVLVKPLEIAAENKLWALERDRSIVGVLNMAFADANAHCSLDFWTSLETKSDA